MDAVAMINGRRMPLADAALPVTDEGVARGDGAFETIGVWGGRAFRLGDHLDRLAGSLRAVGLPAPDRELLAAEAQQLLEGTSDDGALRVYVTASQTRLLTLSPPPQRPDLESLGSRTAPWIRPVGSYGPAGAKTMSYLPNMAAIRSAQAEGFDDALLLALEGWILEGPTFAVIWVSGGALYTPPLDLGIIDSISRRTVLEIADEAGIEVILEPRPLTDLLAASEVLAVSSVRDLMAVRRVDDTRFDGATPLRDRLSAALEEARRS